MKIEMNSDQNPLVMQSNWSPDNEALEGLFDEGFFGRVYRTTLVVWAVVAALLYASRGLPCLIGLSLGTAITTGSMWLIEQGVRHLARPGVRLNARWIAALVVFKLPLLTLVVAVPAWAAVAGVANVFALVGGFVLVHGVMVMKVLGTCLLAALPQEPEAVKLRKPVRAAARAARPLPAAE